MSGFIRHWKVFSGVVGGFSAGAATALILPSPSNTDQPGQEQDLRQVPDGVPAAVAPWVPSPSTLTGHAPPDPLEDATQSCRKLVLQTKEEMGIPGLSVAVNVNGRTVWSEGFGYSDVENGVPCTPQTVMRIASISKPLTMAALAKLWEDGKVDLDIPVQHYVPNFPRKTFEGETVDITTRMLVSHLSGIRHWKGDEEKEPSDITKNEFYMNVKFKTVEDALSIFKDDELIHKPGTEFSYSSPTWTLISTVMEKAANTSYRDIMYNLFNQLGMRHTTLDENEPLTMNRARYYKRNKHGRLVNSPCVDNSCKWAGGGLQSTVGDLVSFGDAMLYCHEGGPRGYLQKDTIDALWTVTPHTLKQPKKLGFVSGYGMGWFVTPHLTTYGGVKPQPFSVNHSGGAVGASSILYIDPHPAESVIPSGVVVAIIVNLQEVPMGHLAREIGNKFWNASCKAREQNI